MIFLLISSEKGLYIHNELRILIKQATKNAGGNPF